MKTIYKGKDDLYYTVSIKSEDGKSFILPSDLDTFIIEFYTTSSSRPVEYDADDLTAEGILHVNASDIQDLPDGPLKARFHIGIHDEAYKDGVFDQMSERLTGYFLKTLNRPETINASTAE